MPDITYLRGDATNPGGDGQKIIVHCCNDEGAWGSGFVISLSRRWKEPERQYRRWYRSKNAFSLGNVQFVRVKEDILQQGASPIFQPGRDPIGACVVRPDGPG